MIFNVPGHIDLIKNGQKTQTRRVNRGIYQEWRDYAVQQKRGVKAESDIRVVLNFIYQESVMISKYAAQMEGCYTPVEYEQDFKKSYPKWDGMSRWVFKFYVIEVSK